MGEKLTPSAPESFVTNENPTLLQKRTDMYFGKILISLGFNPTEESELITRKEYKVSLVGDQAGTFAPDGGLTVLLVRGCPVAMVWQNPEPNGIVRFMGTYLTPEMDKGIRK